MKPSDQSIQNGYKKDLSRNSDVSVASLHSDIQDVINTMGPPTPLFPINLNVESDDEATITSNNFSHNSNVSNGTSNSSYVEVIIKNHHRKSKILCENSQVLKPNSCNVLIQTDNKVIDHDNIQDQPREILKDTSHQIINNKNDENKENLKTNRSVSHLNFPILPQRYFKINTTSNKKQGIVIDIPPEKGSVTKRFLSKNSSKGEKESSFDVKKSEKEIYMPDMTTPTKNLKQNGKTELYYFDRGNFSFYKTTDYPPIIMADHLAEKTEVTAIRFWAEAFGMTNIILAFVTTFILQLIRFVLFGVLRPMTAGVIQLTSDYFLKPLLASLFNGIIQPPMIFLFHILSSVRDVCEPVAQTLGFFMKEFALVFKSFRLVEITKSESHMV